MIHLDASYLIDLQRETKRGRPGRALDFVEALDAAEILGVSIHVVCELRTGAELSRHPLREHEELDHLLSGLVVAYPDSRFAPAYGRLCASVHRGRRSIATMDLLVATTALLDDAPLVTRNVKDFSRVPGLRLLEY
ncbi:MAG: type II toxin-antitoxin system VapC family toxin [Vicinamibacterales bacterium]